MLNHAYRMAARRKSEAMIWVRDHAVLVKPVAPFHLVPASGGLVLFTQGKQILGGSFRLDFVERHLDGVFLHRGFTNSFALSDLLDRMERVPGSAGTVVRSEGVLTCPDSQESSDQADVEVERWLRRDFHIYSQRRKQRGQPPLARRPS